MNRKEVRKEMIYRRNRLGPAKLNQLGEDISKVVLSSKYFHESQCIHCFYGTVKKGEIPTDIILKQVLSTSRTLVMPRVTDDPGVMEHIRVNDLAALVEGIWGIKEPASGESVETDTIDLVFVPGLAADRKGNRIGYGKGYYDRFLASAPNAIKIMLVPSLFILNHIPPQKHDVPVDLLVTETDIIICSK